MCATPTRHSVEMSEELTLAPRNYQGKSLIKVLNEDEDFVKQEFPVSDDRVGRFLFDKKLQIVKLYVLESYEEYTFLLCTCFCFPVTNSVFFAVCFTV